MKADVQAVDKELQKNPYDCFMGFHVSEVSEDHTVLVFVNSGTTWDNPNGTLYGGVLYSMAASAMETACSVYGKAVLTLDLSMNFLRPAFSDTVIRAEAKIIHNGHTTIVALCDLYDNNDRYLAHGKGTFFVTGPYEFGGGKQHDCR